MNNGDKVQRGIVANLNEFGYDVVDSNGVLVMHITIGDVMCDLGVCDHEEYQHE
jgi:hypothetical protein